MGERRGKREEGSDGGKEEVKRYQRISEWNKVGEKTEVV